MGKDLSGQKRGGGGCNRVTFIADFRAKLMIKK